MYVLIILISLYTLFIGLMIYGWLRLAVVQNSNAEVALSYSVIVAARNEEQNILRLLESLKSQNFPADRYEVIVVDDHSEDTTAALVMQFVAENNANIKLLQLQGAEGKKNAIVHAVEEAKGDIIVATDADCQMSPGWLGSISKHYEGGEPTEMVTGPVAFTNDRCFFQKLQTMELAALIGSGAASLALGIPNMCNGANISYRKQSFYTVGGYSGNEDLPGGDDEFLMHKFHEHFPGKVRFNKAREGIVLTHAFTDWLSFFYQRKRWASKWRHYSSVKTSLLAAFIFTFQAAFFLSLYLLVTDFAHYQWLAAPVAAKILSEAILIILVLKFSKKSFNPFLFLFLQFTYPLYVILFGIAANFGKYTWKGRHHRMLFLM